uniref:Uncharacterized protein n=1 Tax=Cajanus cajan TaxID=3821 RepID=A0A151QPC7_CAJCA|nr:hypothetical protein KK1_047214 [Cajanus cajan]
MLFNEDSNTVFFFFSSIDETFVNLLHLVLRPIFWLKEVIGLKLSAASAAAARISLCEEDELTIGRKESEFGKFNMAEVPLITRAPTSCALAAISGVGYVPNQILDVFFGSLSSHTHFPFLCRTPL